MVDYVQPFSTSPESHLRAAFEHIEKKNMAGLPILNTKLQVAIVGMQPWDGYWVGILLTPWTMSIVLMAGEDQALPRLKLDEKTTWGFPSGDYEFMGLDVEGAGYCHLCSLISPVFEFQSQEDALAAATAAVEALMQVPDDQAQALMVNAEMDKMRLEGKSITSVPISRRNFLRGSFLSAE